MAAARQRLEEWQQSEPFDSPADLEAFFRECDTLEDPKSEPEWAKHLGVIAESRRRGLSDT